MTPRDQLGGARACGRLGAPQARTDHERPAPLEHGEHRGGPALFRQRKAHRLDGPRTRGGLAAGLLAARDGQADHPGPGVGCPAGARGPPPPPCPASRPRRPPRSPTCATRAGGAGTPRGDVGVLDEGDAGLPDVDADVGHLHLAGEPGPSPWRSPGFSAAKVTVRSAVIGRPGGFARVPVDARGDVDGEHQGTGRHGGGVVAAPEPRAVGGVDDEVARRQARRGARGVDHGDPRPPAAEHRRPPPGRRPRCCPCRRPPPPGGRSRRRACRRARRATAVAGPRHERRRGSTLLQGRPRRPPASRPRSRPAASGPSGAVGPRRPPWPWPRCAVWVSETCQRPTPGARPGRRRPVSQAERGGARTRDRSPGRAPPRRRAARRRRGRCRAPSSSPLWPRSGRPGARRDPRHPPRRPARRR